MTNDRLRQLGALDAIRESIDLLAKTLLDDGMTVKGATMSGQVLGQGEGEELRQALEATTAAVRDTAALGRAFNKFAQIVERLDRSVKILSAPRVFTLTESVSPTPPPVPK